MVLQFYKVTVQQEWLQFKHEQGVLAAALPSKWGQFLRAGRELERRLWSNCYLGLCVYSALCTWRRLAFYGLVQEGLISSGQQYPVQHQVRSQNLAVSLETCQMNCLRAEMLMAPFWVFLFFHKTRPLYIHDCFHFMLRVLQELKIDN